MRSLTIHHIDVNIGTGNILPQGTVSTDAQVYRLILPKRLVERADALRDLRRMSPSDRSTLARIAGIRLTYVPSVSSSSNTV